MRRFELFAYFVTLLCACVVLNGVIAFGATVMPGAPPAATKTSATPAWQEEVDFGKRDKLIEILTKIVKLNPENPAAFEWRAAHWENLGRNDKALADYARYIELRPNETLGYVRRGLLLSNLGDQKAAARDYEKARKIDDKCALAWSGLGMTYLRSGDPKGAIPIIDQSLVLNPENHWAWNNRACANAALGKYGLALRDENRAIELNPTFGHHYFKRGLIWRALGNTKQMEISFRIARKLNFDVDGYLLAHSR